jgi:hypothetical protein
MEMGDRNRYRKRRDWKGWKGMWREIFWDKV